MRPAFRLARREIVRHKWRSLLVLILIGLPVMASVAAATLVETGTIDSAEADRYNYASAQVQAVWPNTEPLTEAAARAKLAELTDLPIVDDTVTGARLAVGLKGWEVNALRTDFASPITDGIATLLDGRLPRAGDEIAVTPDLTHDGLGVGTRASMGGVTVTVVGVATTITNSSVLTDAVFVPSGSPAKLPGDGGTAGDTSTSDWRFLVGGPGDVPLSDAESTAMADAGFAVSTRGQNNWGTSGASGQDGQLIALLVVCLLIEIVLLAGPAFAVGVRRQRHALALLAVAGGSRRDIRRTVLAQAVILGLAASAIGALVAIPLTWLGLWVLSIGWGEIPGPFDIGWISVIPAIVLGTLSAVLAALIPARLAARADVVTALAGRQPAPQVKGGWPILGIAVLALGTLGCLSSLGRGYGDFANAWWAVVSVCGAVMMTPWLISLIARLAPRLPLPLRLALRDADRHRSRSAPAVAAVMASVSAVVALGIGSASDQASSQFEPEYRYPLGTVTLSTESTEQMTATLAAIKGATGTTFTPMARLDDYSVTTEGSRIPENAYTIAVADPDVLQHWGVKLSDTAAAQLRSGHALVDPSVVVGHGTVEVSSWDDDTESSVRIPAYRTDLAMDGDVPDGITPIVAGIVVSAETARAFGLTDTGGTQEAIADDPSAADTSAVRAAAAGVSPFGWSIDTVTRQHSDYWLLLGLLSLLAAFTVLLGTFSATGLALDDAKHDMATLSAVGARPVTRRIVAGTHAALIALLGAVLGIAVGFTPGITAAYLLTSNYDDGWTLRIPWLLLLLLLIVLPIVAGGVTALVSRTRTVSLRRAA